MDKVSIIIPIYKVEKYIEECLDSVIGQSYLNLEIILVDDGSPDNCPKICDAYAEKDERIIVIHQVNAGVSMARNVGLDICTGEWVMFVDPDDVLHRDIVKVLYNHTDDSTEVITCGYHSGQDKEFSLKDDYSFDVKKYNMRILLLSFLYAKGHPLPKDPYLLDSTPYKEDLLKICVVWGRLYRNSIIKEFQLRFVPNLAPGQDQIFLIELYALTNVQSFIPFVGYYYRENPTSVVNRKKTEKYLLQARLLREHFNSNKKNDDFVLNEAIRVRCLGNLFSDITILYEIKSEISKKEFLKYQKEILQELNAQLLSTDSAKLFDFGIIKTFVIELSCFLLKNKFYKLTSFLLYLIYGCILPLIRIRNRSS